MGRVYAVVSAKGGVGKTTTTTNLAAALAASGAAVAVVDGDLGMANLAGSLGVDSVGATLHDVLAGEVDLADATRKGPHGMTVVPGSPDLDAFARADPEGLRDVLEELRDQHDYVLLDTGAGLSNDTVVPLTYVDEALLVSTTGRDALGDTEKTRQVAERLDIHVAGAVITRVDPDSPQNAAVEETLRTTVLSSIPDSDVVRDAGDAGEPLTTYAPGSSAAAAYRALAADLTGESVRKREADGADETEATDKIDGAGDPNDTSDSNDASPVDEENIIVAGDHDADGDPTDAGAVEADADEDPPADPTESEDASDPDPEEEPLVEVDVSSEVGPNRDDHDDDDSPADDDPLIETAEPDEVMDDATDSDGDAADDSTGVAAVEADEEDSPAAPTEGEDAPDADLDIDDAANDSEADDEEGDEESEDPDDSDDPEDDDGEEGVYTTSLTDEDEDDEKKEKKGLFGRFLG
ncbi:cell division ATPase MinD [Halogeometricum pallidum]|nr:cell division ATPase MinD [Halogeometricum pallidum]